MDTEFELSPEEEFELLDSAPDIPTDIVKYDNESIQMKIIKSVDDYSLERLTSWDTSITISDAVKLKDSALKQIQAEKWVIDDWSWPRLIPSVINIQVINN